MESFTMTVIRAVPILETLYGFHSSYVSNKSSIETIMHNAGVFV